MQSTYSCLPTNGEIRPTMKRTIAGKTLKIFVRGPSPRSLKSVELSNWTGLAFLGERSQIQNACKIEALSDTGIYLLLGDTSEGESGLTQIYIGETENFSKRIGHHKSKDWWTQFVVFVSKDRNLTKAHVKHLEQKIYDMADQAVSTVKIMNSNAPSGSGLPESDEADMEEFMDNMIFVLETLSLSYFANQHLSREQESTRTQITSPDYSSTAGMTFSLKIPNSNSRANMVVDDGIFVLLAGSYIRAEPANGFKNHCNYSLWKQIVDSDAVVKDESLSLYRTTRDLDFKSPSAAGAVARGVSTNGRTDWIRDSDGKPLNECETEAVEPPPSAA